jgi:hypothetical protein
LDNDRRDTVRGGMRGFVAVAVPALGSDAGRLGEMKTAFAIFMAYFMPLAMLGMFILMVPLVDRLLHIIFAITCRVCRWIRWL